MSDIPTKTYPPSFLRALIADHEIERLKTAEAERLQALLTGERRRMDAQRADMEVTITRLTVERDQAQSEVSVLNARMTDAIARIRALTVVAEQAEATPEETTKRHDHRQSVWLVGDVLWCYQCGAWRQAGEGRHPWHKPTGIGGPNPCSTGTSRGGTR